MGFAKTILAAVEKCRESHQNCGAKEVGVLPKMVLDVSASESSGRIFLRAPDQQMRGDYVALSYCWGGPQKIVTTIANNAEHRQRGIELSRLPRTIADAVHVTESLGIPFLADDGFLEPLDGFSIVPIRVDEKKPSVPVYLALGDLEVSHIDSRGWTFQERHLASRTLDFRGWRKVSRSCQESFITYVGGAQRDGGGAWKPDERKLAEKRAVRANARGLWQAMLEEYTVRRITETEDRLPALAGFANIWAEQASAPPGQYMAGFWEGQLIDDLMWRSGVQHMDPGRCSIKLKAGSFITSSQRIQTRLGGNDENKASPIRHSVSLAQADAPFGRAVGGEIALRAQVVPVPENIE
ncbi:hypothetical protein VUR80DRAFT_8220 [Thermomyces stellatus]